MGLKHAYKSLKPDPADPTIIGSSKWNADHYFMDAAGAPIGNVGALLYVGAIGAVAQIDSVAAGQVLASAGAGVVPAWTASPTLTSLTVTGGITAGSIVITGGGGTISGPELGVLDGVTPGIVTALKAVVVDANKDIGNFRNVTFDPAGVLSWGVDLNLTRDGTGTLAQRSGNQQQSYAIYNKYTDAANFERGVFLWSGNTLYIGTVNGGTGVARDLVFVTGAGAQRWTIGGTTGHLFATVDNSYDIGAAANRPRNIYASSSFVIGTNPASTGAVRLANNQAIYSRNAGNTGDVFIVSVDTSDRVTLGDGSKIVMITAYDGSVWQLIGSNTSIRLGSPTATQGLIRLPHLGQIFGRDSANTANRSLVDWGSAVANVLTIGDTLNARTVIAGGEVVVTTATSVQIRNGGAAQQVSIYRTYTDASNYERMEIGAEISGLGVGTFGMLVRTLGTGVARPLYIGNFSAGLIGFLTSGVTRWNIDLAGHFSPNLDNTYDFGGASLRPRRIYTATAFIVGDNPAASGAIRLANNTGVIWRNGANTGDIGFTFDASNVMHLPAAGLYLDYVTSYLAIGTNPAAAGAIRVGNNQGIRSRNAANTDDVVLIVASSGNEVRVGSYGTTQVSLGTGLASTFVLPLATNMTALGATTLQWSEAYVAKYNSSNPTGTLVSNDAQVVAVNAIISLGPNGSVGLLTVAETSGGALAIYLIGGGNTQLVSTNYSAFGIGPAGTAGKINVYYSVANSRFELENKSAGALTIRLIRLGF